MSALSIFRRKNNPQQQDDFTQDLPDQTEGIDLQKALEEREDPLPASTTELWKQELKVNPPSIKLSADYVQETKELNKGIQNFTREEVRQALFRAANDLGTLFTREIPLANIPRSDKEKIRASFMLAMDSLVYNERADLEFQIFAFSKYAFQGYSRIVLSRGVEGTTLKEINSQRVYNEQNLRQSKSRPDKPSITDKLGGLFGGGDNPLSGLMSGGYL